ncbi:hypothetical protein [Mangrovibacterium sp.]|uniref:hypothetical protein n=1 Tax=Mangrovibacterium sp. TaxID=1961364 RepID=UPI0035651FF9
MKHFLLLVIIVFSAQLLQAQSKGDPAGPNEQSKVTREYDEQGNLIRFDSTYVKSWSSDSTLNQATFNELQKQMEEMFKGSFGDESDGFFGDFFPGSAKEFFGQFDQQFSDSSIVMPGFQNSFPDFDKLHEQMMQRFGLYFQPDSVFFEQDTIPGQFQFDFFGNPEEFEEIRKEFEQHFDR